LPKYTQKNTVSCLPNALFVVEIINVETLFAPLGLRINFSALITVRTAVQATAKVLIWSNLEQP